jgi:hypothetical protein
MLAGVVVGALGGREFATITSTPSEIADAVSSPAGAAVWTGAYLELISYGFFLAFAVWVCAELGGGLIGQIARAAATSYTTVSVVSLAVMDTIAYRSGHPLDLQLATTLITLNEALFVVSWFLSSFFLVAAGLLALRAGRRALGWSAIGIAATTLVVTPLSVDNVAQMANLLWLIWIISASVTIAFRPIGRVGRVAVARS